MQFVNENGWVGRISNVVNSMSCLGSSLMQLLNRDEKYMLGLVVDIRYDLCGHTRYHK